MPRGQWLLWPLYQPVVTLPCDRWAAVAALRAAVAAARRTVMLTALLTFVFVLLGLAVMAVASASWWPALAPGAFAAMFYLVAGVFILFASVFPVMVYLRLSPWISYLEELRRGLEEGRLRVEDVCGKPLTLGPG